ncbi:D-alanyl-D-alanine carboxypeptidase (penicillin-binding protein 5/6) [Thermomonospora echinospora]|uniref:D-alanyl-D-alanine carboxypeptidase (Penicillin-binding protein 5/6) n=1 Tax=Thermomonospora echinospora TaxID=1992 RepID=A0A1H5ZI55_9ACTN|nr:D-alanyl-D-alanine carboxypeptidase [Thermomonospora echinospora]SEG35327.1 D-alanyl-D-alanine carboxypeptidase (penicillin-binding protein 5/6) [Thermomonospora echinospora]
MEHIRRAATALTVPLIAAPLVGQPAVALAAPAARRPAAVRTVPGQDPVGGPRLGERGVVVAAAPGVKAPPKINAGSYLIADAGTGQVLAAKNPHGHFLPASALKMLTAVALIPKLDPDATVRPTQETCDVEGTKVGMTPRLTYKVSDLFHALLMVSGNDAALGLAQAAGGLRPTLDTMNAEARRLRAGDTLAGSPNGLDKDLGLSVRTQHTSAYDLALIMRQGLKMPALRTYIGKNDHFWPAPPTKEERKKGKKTGGYPIYSHIRLLPGQRYAYRGMIGGKNGFTLAAGQTFVGAAQRDGRTIIVTLMNGENLWPDTTELLDWGFAYAGKASPVGVLVDPVDTTKPTPKPRGTGLLPTGPLPGGSSGGDWVVLGGAAGAAVLVAGGLFLLLRRRRQAGAGPAPQYGPAQTTPTQTGPAQSGPPPYLHGGPGGRAPDDDRPQGSPDEARN